MARVITFSRTFPSYHPKKGQPTYFVEKILNSINQTALCSPVFWEGFNWGLSDIISAKIMNEVQPKDHTIRAGKRWKVGDKFSPRVWSGKPYNSKMITIAPDVEVKKVWDFEIRHEVFLLNGKMMEYNKGLDLAENDGLELEDLLEWFQYPKPFEGQIICWNENINY